ncbi:putative HTH-type transcriptional regulator [Nymphon striatum]|nr:putative HTH-type transcriptional regulator [Nymphon striatum]
MKMNIGSVSSGYHFISFIRRGKADVKTALVPPKQQCGNHSHKANCAKYPLASQQHQASWSRTSTWRSSHKRSAHHALHVAAPDHLGSGIVQPTGQFGGDTGLGGFGPDQIVAHLDHDIGTALRNSVFLQHSGSRRLVDFMSDNQLTIADRIQQKLEGLTRARQLGLSILENYPASGLGPLTALAKDADVSVPTVARMVQKLGYKGYPEFQAELREELRAKAKNPIAKHDTWAEAAPEGHMLNRFTDAVIDNVRNTLGQIDPADFDAACALAGDASRHLYIVGGRVTHTLAEYLFLHMQVIRPNLTHVQSTSNSWPHYLLNAVEGDVFIDVRRYENNTLKLAKMAHARGAKIILFTDQWRSPVQQLAEHSFSARIVVPSAWDSATTSMLLVETMIAAIQNLHWETTKERMEELEDMFDQTRLFRKFT